MASVESLGEKLGLSYVGQHAAGLAVTKLARNIARPRAIEIRHDDTVHLTRAAQVVNDRAPHQAST
jgi:hypothetical protein